MCPAHHVDVLNDMFMCFPCSCAIPVHVLSLCSIDFLNVPSRCTLSTSMCPAFDFSVCRAPCAFSMSLLKMRMCSGHMLMCADASCVPCQRTISMCPAFAFPACPDPCALKFSMCHDAPLLRHAHMRADRCPPSADAQVLGASSGCL